MDFEKMCLEAGLKKSEAKEYAECVDASNHTDMLLMLYFGWGMKMGKIAAQEMQRLDDERAKHKKKKSDGEEGAQ